MHSPINCWRVLLVVAVGFTSLIKVSANYYKPSYSNRVARDSGTPQMPSMPGKPVTDICLGCICEAIGGCDINAPCESGACGLFRITYPYWIDGGSQMLNGDWMGCVKDVNCAVNTIQNYMIRYSKDCNYDGRVDCLDYAAIHKLGGFGCTGDVGQEYRTKIDQCLRREQSQIGYHNVQPRDVSHVAPSRPQMPSMPGKPVTDVCLGCICEAIGGCDINAACESGACGLFRITQPYWMDGGSQMLNGDWMGCVKDVNCAVNTIQNYMIRYSKDCNYDGRVDCLDYAAIHKLGGFGCSGDVGQEYRTKIDQCLRREASQIGYHNVQPRDVSHVAPSRPQMPSMPGKPVTDVCLGCICEAIGGCDINAACESGACGLFRITQPYWMDGGSQMLNGDWMGCVKDVNCAVNTIQNYMIRYSKDCNYDGRVDCLDYAAIHKLGGFGCTGDVGQEYRTKIDQCLRREASQIGYHNVQPRDVSHVAPSKPQMPSMPGKPVTDICLGCICEAIGDCDLNAPCTAEACGLFRITQPYWIDGGSQPMDGGWMGCVKDVNCAANTVQNYMIRYGKDCNHDGRVDCLDYAAIHKLGGFGCTGDVGQEYRDKIDQCLRRKAPKVSADNRRARG